MVGAIGGPLLHGSQCAGGGSPSASRDPDPEGIRTQRDAPTHTPDAGGTHGMPDHPLLPVVPVPVLPVGTVVGVVEVVVVVLVVVVVVEVVVVVVVGGTVVVVVEVVVVVVGGTVVGTVVTGGMVTGGDVVGGDVVGGEEGAGFTTGGRAATGTGARAAGRVSSDGRLVDTEPLVAGKLKGREKGDFGLVLEGLVANGLGAGPGSVVGVVEMIGFPPASVEDVWRAAVVVLPFE